jgi:hypothetical protein
MASTAKVTVIADADRSKVARSNLKNMGVDVNLDRNTGSLVFVIPKHIEDDIKRNYRFNVDMLRIGGDIPLPDLAIHADEQSATEYHIGTVTEFVKHQLEAKRIQYDMWYEKIYYRSRNFLVRKEGTKGITEKYISSYITDRHGKRMLKYKNAIALLEMQYRMLNNVIRASVITKGSLLGTIRSIIQGKDGAGVGQIARGHGKEIREKLTVKEK